MAGLKLYGKNPTNAPIKAVINIIDTKDEKFILDSAHILPQDISQYLDRDKWDIYFLGYPSVTAEEKLKIIRKYETENDWTYKRTDEEMLIILHKLIDISREIKSECERLDITFIDTGKDLNDVIKTLIK